MSFVIEDAPTEIINYLQTFNYWENKLIEDPSFWKGDDELLASITHENLVMVDMNYFEDMLEGIDLYDFCPTPPNELY